MKYFKHNDMHDLERLLEEQALEDKKVSIKLMMKTISTLLVNNNTIMRLARFVVTMSKCSSGYQ